MLRSIKRILKTGFGLFFVVSLLTVIQLHGHTPTEERALCDLRKTNRTAAANRDHLIEHYTATRDKNLGLARIQGERDLKEDAAQSEYAIRVASIYAAYLVEEAACYLLTGPAVGPCIGAAKALSVSLTAAAYNTYRLAMDTAAFNFSVEKGSIMNEWQDRLEAADNLLADSLFAIKDQHMVCVSGADHHTH